MKAGLWRPALGVLAAIAITTAMDASGLSALSALPLCPLMGLLWYLERPSRPSMGFVWGRPAHYLAAVAYPLVVLAIVALVAAAAGAVDLSRTDWKKAGLNLALVSISTIPVAIVTEEGFFRGWLWASLERSGLGVAGRVIGSSIAFSLWHLSAVTLETGFDLPKAQVPIFMVNAAVIGAVWGLLRGMSGSVIVTSVSHGAWNGLAYVLFGFGTKIGALGIKNTAVFGPEVGIVGLALNAVFAVALWRGWQARAGTGDRRG
jgi:uncharacterized protein